MRFVAGKASLVFDAIFSEKLRERVAKDSEFKHFIMELALEKVEEGSGLVLGRDIATPNLKSKGPLDERTALLPASWLSASSSSPVTASLIQEVTTPTVSASTPQSTPPTPSSQVGSATPVIPPSLPSTPKWTLEIESTGTGPRARTVRIEVQIPLMTKPDYSQATLDLEPNRLILDCPPSYSRLDVPIFAPSTKDKANPGRSSSTTSAGAPKKVLSLDIDDAKAEWRVKNGLLVITSTILSV
ncbi:hypothetical protein DL93DRAFT_296430 [Clavulina sp. PMI_390]|nr:hypothetical protein DL93DRAFT_296430 [Clavulina sp. PMI_390]